MELINDVFIKYKKLLKATILY